MQSTKKAIQHMVLWGFTFLLVLFIQQNTNVATAAATTVSTYEELVVAIENVSPEDTIYIENDLDLIDTIEIDKSLTIASTDDEITLTTSSGYRHFRITGDKITLSFLGVVLDGSENAGGIYTSASELKIENAVIKDCVSTKDFDVYSETLGGGIYVKKNSQLKLINSTLMHNSAEFGGAIYIDNGYYSALTISDSEISNHPYTGSIIYSPAGFPSPLIEITNTKMTENNSDIVYSNGKLVMKNCEIFNNNGGGFYVSIASIFNCSFHDNTGEYYVGLQANDLIIEDSQIYNNSCVYSNAGVQAHYSLKIYNCDISHNITGRNGGGINVVPYDDTHRIEVEIINSRILGNEAKAGGGVYIANESSIDEVFANIIDCDITHNKAELGSGIYTQKLSNLQISGNSRIENNIAPQAYHLTDPEFIALHNQLIESTVTWSSGFTYIYNNLDVYSPELPEKEEVLHNVTVITKYRDGALPEQSVTYQVADGSRFEEQFEMLEGYQVSSFGIRSLSYGIDEDSRTVYIDPVLQDCTITIELARKQYIVTVVTSFQDGSHADVTETHRVLHGDAFDGIFNVPDGYRVRGVEANLIGLTVDWYDHTISVDSVTQNMRVTIFLNT